MTSNKSHTPSPHSHKPCPPGSGSAPPASDISLNGSRSQQNISRYQRRTRRCFLWRPRSKVTACCRERQLALRSFSPSPSVLRSTDVDMEVEHFSNGVTESSSNGFLNGSSKHANEPDDCEADMGGWSL